MTSWKNTAQAAEYTGKSIHTIRDAAQAGDLTGCKGGKGRWSFRTEDLDAWLERGRVDIHGDRRLRAVS